MITIFVEDFMFYARDERFQDLTTTTTTHFFMKNNHKLWLSTFFSDHNLGDIRAQT